MPELPEVEVVRAGLERHVVGVTLATVEVRHPRSVRRDPRGPAGFATALTGRRVEGARRWGKYLWLPLDSGDAIVGHLGMSGQLLVQPAASRDQAHLRVRFGLARPDAGGTVPTELRFVDQRMFGGLLLSAGGATLPPEVAHIARDPLDPEFDDSEFVSRVRHRTAGIKRLLLDQTLVSGIGNIYADEALWRARLHGDRPGYRLTPRQVRELVDHVRGVLADALAQGGTSFDTLYVDVNGRSGYFDRSLNAYGQAGRACARCGTQIRRVPFMNRSSYFCPVCQRPPRAPRHLPPGPASAIVGVALTGRGSGETLEDARHPRATPPDSPEAHSWPRR